MIDKNMTQICTTRGLCYKNCVFPSPRALSAEKQNKNKANAGCFQKQTKRSAYRQWEPASGSAAAATYQHLII